MTSGRSAIEKSRTCSRFVIVTVGVTVIVTGMLAFLGPPLAAQQRKRGEATLQTELAKLKTVVLSMEENLAQQETLWPTRNLDQINEIGAPPAVRELQGRYRWLSGKQDRLVGRIGRKSEQDSTTLLKTVRDADELGLVEALVPTVAKVAKRHAQTLPVLKQLTLRFRPVPGCVIRALGELGTREAGLFLLELAKKQTQQRLAILKAACDGGQPQVIAKVITWGDGPDRELAQVCRRALGRVSPPRGQNSKLGSLVTARIDQVKSLELRALLVSYLAQTRKRTLFDLFRRLYDTAESEEMRVAAISAMGGQGERGGKFAVQVLADSSSSRAVKKASVYALGSTR